jgi:hypothetical protein
MNMTRSLARLVLVCAIALLAVPAGQSQGDQIQDEALARLVGVLKNGDMTQRALAARALRGFAVRASLEALITALSDPVPQVRAEAIASLQPVVESAFTAEDFVSRALPSLADSSPMVRDLARDLLVWSCKWSRDTPEDLIRALDDDTQAIRVASAENIASCLSDKTITVGRKTAMVLGDRIGRRAYAGLSSDLDDKDARVRCKVARALSGWLIPANDTRERAKNVQKAACREVEQWGSAENANTTAAYEEFARKYADSSLAQEARRRAADAVQAFLVACHLGSRKALEGFLKSHPNSDNRGFAADYVDLLEATEKGDLETLTGFVSSHPNSPFLPAAALLSPLLVLKQAGGTVEVVIDVKHLENRGLLGGRVGTKAEARDKVWEGVAKQLSAQGVPSVLLDTAAGQKHGGAGYRLLVEYSESPKSPTPNYGSPDLASVLRAEAVRNLNSIFFKDVEKTTTMVVEDARDSINMLGRFSSLSQVLPLATATRLLPVNGSNALTRFLLTLPHVDLMDPQQLADAKAVLGSTARRDWK